jgi:hypothetical protein
MKQIIIFGRESYKELIEVVNNFLAKFDSKDVYDVQYQDVPSGPTTDGMASVMITYEDVKV